MANRRPRETDEYFGGLNRMLKAGAERLAQEDPDVCVKCIRDLEAMVAEVRTAAVWGMRNAGFHDGQIADALGVTRQAVSQRWPRHTSAVSDASPSCI